MKTLASGKYNLADDFINDSLDTLAPGIIPREAFIKWSQVKELLAEYSSYIEFYTEMQLALQRKKSFIDYLSDSLLAMDDPQKYIQCAFQLLAHTPDIFVTKANDITIKEIAQEIIRGNEQTARYLTGLLKDLGFCNILERQNLQDVFLGIHVGLKTHRRNNIGGETFKDEFKFVLERIVHSVSNSRRKTVTLSDEKNLPYGEGLSKTVDFLIKVDGRNTLGIEVNFYTVSGSKPTEIKRSYGNIRAGLTEVGIDLIWITDGKGYCAMKGSLMDAYIILPNIYNLRHLENNFANDLKESIG